jgi:hypothetical protein
MVEKSTWALPLETGVGVNALPKRRNDYRGVYGRILSTEWFIDRIQI